MKVANSKDTRTMKYFWAAFKKWFESSNLNLMEAGAIFDLSHTFISQILNRKASLSIGTAESIAYRLGKDLPEMLIEGREILGEQPSFGKPVHEDPNEKAIEAFRFILFVGGEAAESLADQAIRLAQKKQAESGDPTIRQGYKSAS